MNLLVVIPFDASSVEKAESLIDFIYFLSGKNQHGSCLLVSANAVHPEYQTKIRLASQVTFESVDFTIATTNLFSAAMERVNKTFKSPWLYLEPDSVPLKKSWIQELEIAYRMQAKKYMGAHVKNETGELLLARQAIYPPDAIKDFSEKIEPIYASTKCRLIQIGEYKNRADIRPDAVLFYADRSGELIKTLRKEIK